MSYVLAGLLVLLLVAIGVTLLMVSARRHGEQRGRAAADESYGGGLPGSDTAILAAEPDSPLGDTSEHAGRQRDGETIADEDATRPRPGAGDPHAAPPVDGGEAEGRRRI
jgi:hypothetical protein